MDSISYSEEYRQLQNKLRELERENTLLKEKLEKYSLLRDRRFIAFQTINVGLVIFDSNGVILDINKYLCDYFNVNMNQVVDRNITHFVQQEERLVIREHMDAIKTKSGTFQSIFPLTINGRKHYFETQTSRLPGEMGFITIIEKITKECEREKRKKRKSFIMIFLQRHWMVLFFGKNQGRLLQLMNQL
ncbi:PAS domain S-box protein [Niallia circulans]